MANSKTIALITSLCVLFFSVSIQAYCLDGEVDIKNADDGAYDLLLSSARDHYNSRTYDLAISAYHEALNMQNVDSVFVFQELAFSYAKSNEAKLASRYIEKHIVSSLDIDFINHSYFDQISDSESYQALTDKYAVSINLWSIFCFYVGFVGFFIAIVLNFRKRSDKIANLLMSMFVLQHSFFIIHICFLLTKYQYYLPHTLYMSTAFSFLYGPLIYFYFKRVTLKYKFRVIDVLHLLPTVFLITFLLMPVYVQTGEEKLRMMLNGTTPHGTLITVVKLLSLIIYGVLVIKMYIESVRNNKGITKILYNWQRNIVIFCSVYIVTYGIYAVLIMSKIYSGLLFDFQVASMALLVLYVSYTAFVQPSIFGSLRLITYPDDLEKYKKSGLTEGLSKELKEKLLYLLDQEKIYKQNDINLHKISELLETTRHNASQIINEHFDLNFFELINTYRIEEAMRILKSEDHSYLNIIDVAYEVGFNNKVTFNKSFKKYNQITPSEFVKSLVA